MNELKKISTEISIRIHDIHFEIEITVHREDFNLSDALKLIAMFLYIVLMLMLLVKAIRIYIDGFVPNAQLRLGKAKLYLN